MNASYGQTGSQVADTLIALERAALEKWNGGDPSGYLDLSAEEVTYFDPFTERRLDGKEQLARLYEQIRGQVRVDRYELLHPRVQAGKGMAVVTFHLVSYEGSQAWRWNCTEVYRQQEEDGWKIIHTHWSFTRPDLK